MDCFLAACALLGGSTKSFSSEVGVRSIKFPCKFSVYQDAHANSQYFHIDLNLQE